MIVTPASAALLDAVRRDPTRGSAWSEADVLAAEAELAASIREPGESEARARLRATATYDGRALRRAWWFARVG